jgi:hypothetical protein
MVFFRWEREDSCAQDAAFQSVPIKTKSRKAVKPRRTEPPKPNSFDERDFFDRLEYTTYRLFLYALALIGKYSVIMGHLK